MVGSRASGRERNESSASLSWLADALGVSPGSAPGPVAAAWAETRDTMREPRNQAVAHPNDWTSDPWLARGTGITGSGMIPTWIPPDGIDEWPAADLTGLLDVFASSARRTRPQTLAGPSEAAGNVPGDAVAAFLREEAGAGTDGAAAVRAQHVRAWLGCAVGPLLREVVLTPGNGHDALAAAAAARLETPRRVNLPVSWASANQFAEKYLDLLYNLRTSADGRLAFPDAADVRTGQGEGWREHWTWLSRDLGLGDVREALRTAARLMRHPPLVEGLLRTVEAQDRRLGMTALGVARRWLLTLKAMAWLEDATAHEWEHVRPRDLACFAFNALKPDWPRRVLGISHRSIDTKSALSRTDLWSSGRCAIDATYVPSWETNTGMVWGLFGATPAIVRVRSAGYEKSAWCRREAELTHYLVERADFLAERWVLDLVPGDLTALEAAHNARDPRPRPGAAVPVPARRPAPYEVPVWTPGPRPAWQTAVLRASAALRVINTLLADAELTNRFVTEFLLGDAHFPEPAPTGHPEGWQAYRSIFRELQALAGGTEPAVRLPWGYSAEQTALDVHMFRRLPHLGGSAHVRAGSGTHAGTGAAGLRDVLVAYEFLRSEWPSVAGDRRRYLAVDCRDVRPGLWAGDERLSLQRGLLAVRTPVPVWIVQRAGQEVDTWPIPGDHPIFTEHFPGQFSWMAGERDDRAAPSPGSGLEFSPALAAMIRRSGDR
ncbi:hypothetical protein DQ384_12125 [Sphaerisporangium album]|uniref:Uncharacterized protein n=1 Tax=Sphaerisporangium album TaxID=509200 RepID=A0A367FKB5_9ACTN|nr:hypothetical protein [Sphaerisporangium album]RCG30734.1 hypothetical protein DQ384_12125 [Sphaerisporangium album]